MTNVAARNFAGGVALLAALFSPTSLHAQIGLGTWVRKPTASMPTMTMTVEACCNGGRRLTYHVAINGAASVLIVESRLDGRDAPVLMAGKPSGETMAIKRVDDRHMSAVLKMNGQVFGTSQATLSPDGKTLTVINDYTSPAGGQPVGRNTEVWVLK